MTPRNRHFKIAKLLPVGTTINCADTSGAKKLKIISYKQMQGADKRRLTGGIGCVALVTVTKGRQNLRRKVHKALIVRQKFPITRFTGATLGKVRFRDNAAVLLDEKGRVTKETVKGPVAKELTRIKSSYGGLNATYK